MTKSRLPRFPDFENRKVLDGYLNRLDTTGVSRRDFLSLATAGAAAAAAAATFGLPSSAVASPDGKLSFVSYTAASEVNVQIGKAFEDASKDLGINYAFLDGKADSGQQLNAFEQELVSNTSAAVFNLADGSSLRRIAQLANQDKVFVANVWDTLPWFTPFDASDYYTLFATPQEVDGYRNLCAALFEEITSRFGGGKILGVTGTNGNFVDINRSKGRDQALAKFPKIQLVDQLPGLWNREASVKATADLLSRHPDIVGIVAQNDDVAQGAIAALKAAGYKPGEDVLVVGAEGLVAGAHSIKDGKQFATAANAPSFIAGYFAGRIYDVTHGWVPRASERLQYWNSPIVTKDNIDAYIGRYIDNGGVKPFDYRKFSKVLHANDWDPQGDVHPLDIDSWWDGVPKPNGWAHPEAYKKAKESGEFETVAAEYADHYKIKFDDPSPVKQG